VEVETDTQLNGTAHSATIGQLLCSQLTACNGRLVIWPESVSSDPRMAVASSWVEALITSGVAFKYLKLPLACTRTHLSHSLMLHGEKVE